MDIAIELVSGRTVPAAESYRTRRYRCTLCNGDVKARAGSVRDPYFAHKQSAPQDCPLRANRPPQKFVEAMTRAILQMRIVLTDGSPELIILQESSRQFPDQRRDASSSKPRGAIRTPLGRRDTDDPTLPRLLGSIVFVRHLGGMFRGHDHRTQPVVWGDDLIVLAEHRTIAPKAGGKNLPKIRLQGRQWLAWHIELPSTADNALENWLAGNGITVETRSAQPRLVTPPYLYADVPKYPAETAISIANGNESARLSMSNPSQTRTSGPKLAPGRLQSVTADESMHVRLASDSQRSHLDFETVRKPRSTGAPTWFVRINGKPLSPFTAIEAPEDTLQAVKIICTQRLTFSLTAKTQNGATRTLLAASAETGSQWISNLKPTAVNLVITAPDGSSVAIRGIRSDEEPTLSPIVDPAAPSASPRHRRRWQGAYRASTHATEHTVRHWQVEGLRRPDPRRRNM